jgi:hypothetical protein
MPKNLSVVENRNIHVPLKYDVIVSWAKTEMQPLSYKVRLIRVRPKSHIEGLKIIDGVS